MKKEKTLYLVMYNYYDEIRHLEAVFTKQAHALKYIELIANGDDYKYYSVDEVYLDPFKHEIQNELSVFYKSYYALHGAWAKLYKTEDLSKQSSFEVNGNVNQFAVFYAKAKTEDEANEIIEKLFIEYQKTLNT